MIEFRVIKCKKCDAALTELYNESLDSCVQCGHQFSVTNNSKAKLDNLTVSAAKYNSKIRDPLNISEVIRQIKQNLALQNSKKATKLNKVQKKRSWVASLIKWYVIWSFIVGLISMLFYDS